MIKIFKKFEKTVWFTEFDSDIQAKPRFDNPKYCSEFIYIFLPNLANQTEFKMELTRLLIHYSYVSVMDFLVQALCILRLPGLYHALFIHHDGPILLSLAQIKWFNFHSFVCFIYKLFLHKISHLHQLPFCEPLDQLMYFQYAGIVACRITNL